MISNRTRSSLCLYLSLHNPADVRILLDRHGIAMDNLLIRGMTYTPYVTDGLRSSILAATSEQLLDLLEGFVKTSGDLRSRISPRYRHKERWEDLFRCLLLDGYRVEGEKLILLDTSIDGVEPLEDDLTSELNRSGLESVTELLRIIDKSAEDFRKMPPDYNGCLTNARITLETITKVIAKARDIVKFNSLDEIKWGSVLEKLSTSGFITKKDEEGLSGVYSFISQGAHRPVGLSEQEIARLGRNLTLSMCYFLVKLHNNTKKN